MALYVIMAAFNLYRLMYPLSAVDVASEPYENLIHPLWKFKEKENLHLQVFLSTIPQFQARFLQQASQDDTALLWTRRFDKPSLQKAFLITNNPQQNDPSYQFAKSWLEQMQKQNDEQQGLISTLAGAGQGIESTSILITFYTSIAKKITSLLGGDAQPATDPSGEEDRTPHRVTLSPNSKIWKSLSNNSTVFVHVILVRNDGSIEWPPQEDDQIQDTVRQASSTHSLLFGQVNMIKHESPHHISQPGRVLIYDFVYLFQKHILGRQEVQPPWDMRARKPLEFERFAVAKEMKQTKAGYPYWKPEVAVKFVNDQESYPVYLAERSGMPLVRLARSRQHPTGYAFTPALHVDEIGLTSEKYIPVNETVTTLPLVITFDRSDLQEDTSVKRGATATAGGMSPARWRLLTHLSEAIEAQKELGFEQSDIDDLRRLIADTNVTLLAVTMLASALHLLFEFLTFKSEVSFWQNNQDLTGLSVRALFLDMMSQSVILLYLVEKDSSLLMTIPSAVGCLIALWKCQRASGLRLVRIPKAMNDRSTFFVNKLLHVIGLELQVPRLDVKNAILDEKQSKGLVALTIESDKLATRTLGAFLLPFVAMYAIYSLCREEHLGWYSWFITTASSAVYALGFVLMTPQLFLNWKLKSVAHLPWRVLCYRTLNTFVDDLFSFVIRMPTMARISCFRDDVVFFIYLYQRWMYPVDQSRPAEGGGNDAIVASDMDKKTK